MLDTNILVSILFFPSRVTDKFMRTLTEKYDIVLCDYVIQELRQVTLKKFPGRLGALNLFLLELDFEKVKVFDERNQIIYPQIRDRKDEPILKTAIKEQVDILVTGDKDFLVLDIVKPRILTMTEFVERY